MMHCSSCQTTILKPYQVRRTKNYASVTCHYCTAVNSFYTGNLPIFPVVELDIASAIVRYAARNIISTSDSLLDSVLHACRMIGVKTTNGRRPDADINEEYQRAVYEYNLHIVCRLYLALTNPPHLTIDMLSWDDAVYLEMERLDSMYIEQSSRRKVEWHETIKNMTQDMSRKQLFDLLIRVCSQTSVLSADMYLDAPAVEG